MKYYTGFWSKDYRHHNYQRSCWWCFIHSLETWGKYIYVKKRVKTLFLNAGFLDWYVVHHIKIYCRLSCILNLAETVIGVLANQRLPSHPFTQIFMYTSHLLLMITTPWPESASELYRPSDRHLWAKLVPTFADRGCHVVSVTDPYGRILGFLLITWCQKYCGCIDG
jgi:hypothetical protein